MQTYSTTRSSEVIARALLSLAHQASEELTKQGAVPVEVIETWLPTSFAQVGIIGELGLKVSLVGKQWGRAAGTAT
jgi:hypothetical protein